MDRPILFSAPMVRAILAGHKTQTRRVVKWRGADAGLNLQFSGLRAIRDHAGMWALESDTRTSRETRCDLTPCPYGQAGDRLWVRETHAIVPRTAYRCSEGVQQVLRPDDDHDAAIFRASFDRSGNPGWKPSIHMPRWASRITLNITNVRVERLLAISEADAQAEGCTPECMSPTGDENGSAIHGPGGFGALWSSINGAESWVANPWVWVVEFQRAKDTQ